MNHIIIALMVALAIMTGSRALVAQTADPVSLLAPTQHVSHRINQTLLTDNTRAALPPVMIGWNWASLPRQASLDVHTNLVHKESNWDGTPPTVPPPATWGAFDDRHDPTSLVPGTSLIFDPTSKIPDTEYATDFPWYQTLYLKIDNDVRHNFQLCFSKAYSRCLIAGIGIRFQPEIEVTGDASSFTPRTGDRQKAIFGFRTRAHGTVPTATTDVNFDRFVLSQTGLTAPQTVLAGSWPDTKFAGWSVEKDFPTANPFNGRQMYLACNLRRVAGTTNDNVDDDQPVLRLRIRRLMCGADPDVPANWAYLKFDSVPVARMVVGTTQNWADLPRILDNTALGADRGRILRCQEVAAGTTVTEITITRGMLPHGSDGRPDITVLAHLVFDPVKVIYDDLSDNLANRKDLRSEWEHLSDGCTGDLIGRLQVEVDYVGNADVAVDWVDLGTDNYTRLMQGYYDRKARDVFDQQLRFLDAYNTRPDLQQNRVRIARWYSRDEGKECNWQAMRHYDLLLGGTSQTERGVHGNQLRYEYILEPSVLWDGTFTSITSSVMVPYARHGWMDLQTKPAKGLARDPWCDIEYAMKSELFVKVGAAEFFRPFDYDLRWGHHPRLTDPEALPAILTTTDQNNAYYPAVYGGTFSLKGSGSLQQAYEYDRWERSLNCDYLFGSRPWVANVWLQSDWDCDKISLGQYSTPSIHAGGWRPQTGEETRLLIWSQLILGSKGFVSYWGASTDSVTSRSEWHRGDGKAKDLGMASGLP